MDIEEIKTFLASEEGATLVEELKQPLINKRDELKNELITAKTDLQTLLTANEDRERATAEASSAAEKEKLKNAGDFDAYKAYHEDEMGKYKKEVSDLKDRHANTEVSRLITEVAAQNSTTPKPLQLLLRERVTAAYNAEGNMEVVVKGEDGSPMYYEGNPASVDHLVASLKSNEEYGAFFSASGASGSGTTKTDVAPNANDSTDMDSENFNLSKAMGNKV